MRHTVAPVCISELWLLLRVRDDEDYACGERTVGRMCAWYVDRWYR